MAAVIYNYSMPKINKLLTREKDTNHPCSFMLKPAINCCRSAIS